MEPLNSSSLGAMGSLIRKLDKLLKTQERAQKLIGNLRIISNKMDKLSEVHSPPSTVIYWMNDARELSYDMEVCVDLFEHASQPEDLSATVAWVFGWTSKIWEFEEHVQEINERCDRYNLLPSSPTKIIARHQIQTLYEEPDPVGMDEPTEKLLEWLMPKDHGEDEDKLHVVSVLGDGGVGKSTIVKRLWRESEDNKFQFDFRAFVQTAKKPDTRMILRSILAQVNPKELPKCSSKVPNLIHDLKEHLHDKRYFIVIDDLWDISVWHIVKRAFPRDGNCRIVTTTTAENIAQACCSYDCNNIVNVKCLRDDQSKQLFVDRAFGSEKGCPTQLNDITDEITGKCGGLPLAIICTARLVANQPETEQGQQLDYVNKFLPNKLRTQSSSTDILTEVLNLCYSRLPCCLRTCLLYLSMYPEKYLFLKKDLVKQWMAEDFICSPEGSDIVDVANGYFDELVSLGLIQRMDISNSNNKELSYTVHPVVFDFITCKSMEDNFITIIDYSQSAVVLSEKVRRLSLHFGSAAYATTPESVELSQIRTVSFIGLLGCMPSIAEFKLVRVMILHIFSEDLDTRFSLAEISKLLQLRYVQVRCNVTVELPSEMQCLKHLETFEINAGVEYVPSDIVHLSRLRHVGLGEKTKRTSGQGEAISSLDWSRLPSPSISLESFELLPPICIFSRLPQWFLQMHKLCILEIVVRKLLDNIDVLAELPVLKYLSLYVQTPPTEAIILGTGMFPALEYFKFVCGVLSLGFHDGSLPHLRKLKLVFNAHKGEQYSNMHVGIEHLLKLQKVAGSIGLGSGAEESDRTAAESAFKNAIRQHPCYPSFKEVVKRVDQVDEDWDQQVESSNERGQVLPWKLAFRNPPLLPIYTGEKIEDDAGNPLEVILVDADIGSQRALPPQFLRVELVPVFGDFPPDGLENWSADEFQRNIAKERGGKCPLLTGDVTLTLWRGRATVGELQFTDNSSWVRCRKFCIGARVLPGSYVVGRIVEAITEAFIVRDHRGELYRKHYPPVLGDSVWRLKNIAKEGAFHRKLRRNNIETVQEFLRMLAVKPDELRVILGDGMTDSAWEAVTTHAKTCDPGDKVYAYSSAGCTIYVNSVFNLIKVEIGGTVCPLQQLNGDQTMLVRQLILQVYEKRYNLMELEKLEKRYPPSLGDSVCMLDNITKEGTFHNNLDRSNIKTVQEFLRMLMVKPDELRVILGDGMTDRAWEAATTHAKTCDPGDKVYAYSSAGCTIYVNSVFNLIKVKIGGTECPLQHLNEDQTVLVRQLILHVYEKRYELEKLEKRYPPSLGDSVCMLENITEEGTLHNNLEHSNIKTVQEFLRMLMVKPDQLRAILGDGMTNDMWEETTKQARTCMPGDKVYVYTEGGGTIYVNSVFNLVKVEIGGIECPLQQLNFDQMMLVLPLIMEAYKQRHHLHETNAVTFDGNNATDNIALLRARFEAQARAGPQSFINNMVPNPWVIQ